MPTLETLISAFIVGELQYPLLCPPQNLSSLKMSGSDYERAAAGGEGAEEERRAGPGVARILRGDSMQGQLLARVRAYFTHPHRELRMARRTWWAGFCGLPLLWLLNWLNLRKAAQEPDALTEIKVLVRLSLFLFSVALSALVAWLAYFQTVTDTMVCPCDGPFGSDWRSVCPEAAPGASHHVAMVLRWC